MKHRYLRVANGVVTHMVEVQPEWIDLNPWPDIPGEWIQSPNTQVSTEWLYDADTKRFDPPAAK